MPISTPSDPQSAALLAHILSQTQQNISFLAAQNYISPTEAADLITRLSQGPASTPATSTSTPDSISSSLHNLAIGPARNTDSGRRVPPPPPRTTHVQTQRARALWAYNEDGREPNDLSFSAGEVIEIVDETNADWWTGKCRGKQGLFPSNHVEKLDGIRIAASPTPPMSVMPHAAPTTSYSLPPGPLQPYDYGMPEKAPMYQSHYVPPAPVAVQAPAPLEEPKKSKFSGLGSTMANSAAGGVGFGAGAAIGSGIVNAIF